MFNKVQTSCFVYKYCVILLLEKECSKIKRKKTALQEKPLFSGSLFPHGLFSDRGVLGKDEVTGSNPVISSKKIRCFVKKHRIFCFILFHFSYLYDIINYNYSIMENYVFIYRLKGKL